MKKKLHISTSCLRFITRMITILVMSISTAWAQPDDNGGEPATSDIPVDGGIAWLLAGGAAHAYKVLRRKKADQTTTKKIEGKQ